MTFLQQHLPESIFLAFVLLVLSLVVIVIRWNHHRILRDGPENANEFLIFLKLYLARDGHSYLPVSIGLNRGYLIVQIAGFEKFAIPENQWGYALGVVDNGNYFIEDRRGAPTAFRATLVKGKSRTVILKDDQNHNFCALTFRQ